MGQYRALLVGVSEFPKDPANLLPLGGPVHDVPAVHAALTAPGTGLFDSKNVVAWSNPTRVELETALFDFFRAGQRDDVLLVYYSGHGRLSGDNRLFLSTVDTDTSRLPVSAIPSTFLRDCMDGSAAQIFVVILDCCHSGAFRGGSQVEALHGRGTFVMSSSRARQLANDGDGKSPSPFTAAFVEALTTPDTDTDHDGQITFDDVYERAYARLAARNQHPQRSTGEGSVTLALSRPGVRPTLTPTATIPESDHRAFVRIRSMHESSTVVSVAIATAVEALVRLAGGDARLSWRYVAHRAADKAEHRVAGEYFDGALFVAQTFGLAPELLWPDAQTSPPRNLKRLATASRFRVNSYRLERIEDIPAQLSRGRLVLATVGVHEPWFTAPDGVVAPSATREDFKGYIAVVIVAFTGGRYWFANVWGPSWGHDGFGSFRAADAAALVDTRDLHALSLASPLDTTAEKPPPSPRLVARFALDKKGVPKSPKRKFDNKHYIVYFEIENAPAKTKSVTYELDETFPDPVRKVLRGPRYLEEVWTYGDFDVSASIQIGKRKLRVEAALVDMLAAGHAENMTDTIAKTIELLRNA